MSQPPTTDRDSNPVTQGGSKAPFVIYGGIFLIGLSTVLMVLISHCNREDPYLDPKFVPPKTPPPPSLKQPAVEPSPAPEPAEADQ